MRRVDYQSIDWIFRPPSGKSKLCWLARFVYPIEEPLPLCLIYRITDPSVENLGNWLVPVVVSGRVPEPREEVK